MRLSCATSFTCTGGTCTLWLSSKTKWMERATKHMYMVAQLVEHLSGVQSVMGSNPT